MPAFLRSLEQSLQRALTLAKERHHEYATPEHLLLALLEDPDAAAVMRACSVDLDKLRRSLTTYLDRSWRVWLPSARRIRNQHSHSSA